MTIQYLFSGPRKHVTQTFGTSYLFDFTTNKKPNPVLLQTSGLTCSNPASLEHLLSKRGCYHRNHSFVAICRRFTERTQTHEMLTPCLSVVLTTHVSNRLILIISRPRELWQSKAICQRSDLTHLLWRFLSGAKTTGFHIRRRTGSRFFKSTCLVGQKPSKAISSRPQDLFTVCLTHHMGLKSKKIVR